MATYSVRVSYLVEVEAPDETLDEIMSAQWQNTYYSFSSRNEAIAWLAWVVDEWGGPDHVDGLVGMKAETRKIDLEYEVER